MNKPKQSLPQETTMSNNELMFVNGGGQYWDMIKNSNYKELNVAEDKIDDFEKEMGNAIWHKKETNWDPRTWHHALMSAKHQDNAEQILRNTMNNNQEKCGKAVNMVIDWFTKPK